MKTYKSMLSVVCCWCLCLSLCTVAFAKEAVTQEEVLNPRVELQVNDKSQAIDKMALQKQKDKEIREAKLQAQLDAKYRAANELLSSGSSPISIDMEETKEAHKLTPNKPYDLYTGSDLRCDFNAVLLTVGGGSYDSEISWDLSDGSSGAAGSFDLCLEDGDYVFNGYDSWGDGWNGASATFTDADGNVIASFAVEGSSGSFDFTIGGDSADDGGADDGGEECADNEIGLTVGGGSYDSEISWDLSDGSSGVAGSFDLCLADGDYVFNGYDSWGDGWNGASATFTDADGNIIASFAVEGSSGSWTVTIGGTPPVAGCTDPGAPNYNADAEVDDGSCEDYCGGTNDCAYWIENGYTCDQLIGWGYDCSACEADGSCDAPVECNDDQFACADGSGCIPASYYCDGSSEYGNAGWGPDCADGSDEIFEDCCAAEASAYAALCGGDDPCESCEFDFTNYGSPCCDTAGTDYGLSCGALEADYSWDCAGCECALDTCGDGYCHAGSGEDADTCPDDCAEAECQVFDCVGTCAEGYESWATDSYCDDGSWGIDFTCAEWNCDNGACGTELLEDGSCGTPPAGCEFTEATLTMNDSWGDGWNGAEFCLTNGGDGSTECASIDTGATGTADFCINLDLCNSWSVGGGSYDSEISWSLDSVDGNLASGYAPEEGELGDCGATDDGGADDGGSDCTDNAINLTVGGGSYDSEISWDLSDGSSGVAGSFDLCLADGDYVFNGYDSWGDGWNGASANFTDADGNLIASFAVEGSSGSWTVTIGGDAPVAGCTDPSAPEYNEEATLDDGSCWAACAGVVSWISDGYCDSSNNNEGCGYDGGDCCPGDCVDSESYDCATFGGDCTTCMDPGSADLAEGGQCADYEITCADTDCGYFIDSGYTCEEIEYYGYDCSECEEECATQTVCEDEAALNFGQVGDCYYTCEEGGLVTDCAGLCQNPDTVASWQGDGLCDDGTWGMYLDCEAFNCDDGDCGELQEDGSCGEPALEWDAEITGLTAEGTGYYGYAAIQWDWDDLSDGDEPYDCAAGWDACVESLAGTEYYEACGAEDCQGGSGGACDGDVVPFLTDECGAFVNYVVTGECADPCPGGVSCPEGEDVLVDCIGTEFCNSDCASGSYDGCVDGESTWIGDGYCDDGSYGLELACAEYNCDGCDCGSEYSSNGDGCNAGCSDPGDDTDSAECAASFTVVGSTDLDGDYYNDPCYTDGTGYFVFDWDGGCLATSITYSGGDMDLSAYGFTDGFFFYGFDPGSTEEFLVVFNNDYDNGLAAAEATSDCPVPETCEDNGLVTCTDGTCAETEADCAPFSCADDQFMCASGDQCIPASYVCDGSTEFCNAGWPADCADGSDEGLELCGYEDECEEGDGGGDPEGCLYDYTNYGSANCDTAWDEYGLDCATLAYSYGWDCSGCSCPGDESAGDGGGDEDLAAACAEAEGHYCGDDESNWTSYSPNGCVPSYYICDGWDDCVDASDEANCDGRSVATAALSTDKTVNAKTFHHQITKYKNSLRSSDGIVSVDKVLNNDRPTVVNIATGEITYGSNSGNRAVSYTINVSCETCLSGGPWSGTWTDVPQSDFLVYGFDDGANACANVIGVSTLLGETAASADACADAGEAATCEFLDCSGQEACGYEDWVGDGYCDDGSWGYYFNCDEFACDAGDCTVACWDGSEACQGSTECPEEPSCMAGDVNGDDLANVQDIVLIVGYILDPASDLDVGCADMNGDGLANVQDVVLIVGGILDGRSTSDATEARLDISNGVASLDANGFVGAVQMTLSHGAGFSIDLTDRAMVAEYRTDGNSTTIVIVAPESDDLFTADGDFTVEDIIVANVSGEAAVIMPSELTLSKAYPNPFNPSTSMNVYVPADGMVSLTVYNVMGQEVATLHSGNMDAGSHTVTWNASQMTSGLYFVRAESAEGVAVQKVMLMK